MRRAAAVLALLVLADCGEGPAGPSEIQDTTWRLVTLEPAGEAAIAIADPDVFTVRFEAGGRLAVRADCNSCGGTYGLQGAVLDIGDAIACTRAFCAATAPLDTRFVSLLAAADRWSTDGGQLVLDSAAGRLRFRR